MLIPLSLVLAWTRQGGSPYTGSFGPTIQTGAGSRRSPDVGTLVTSMNSVRRIALSLMILAWLPALLAFVAPGHAEIRYFLFLAAHALNVAGYLASAVADKQLHLGLSKERLVYAALAELAFFCLCPIVMSAAAASTSVGG